MSFVITMLCLVFFVVFVLLVTPWVSKWIVRYWKWCESKGC
jgi:predicted small integral membrane protein